MDANELDRLARIVAAKTHRTHHSLDHATGGAIVAEAGYILVRTLRNHPEWAPGLHVHHAVSFAASEYYRGIGRPMGQCTRQAKRREPGVRIVPLEALDATR